MQQDSASFRVTGALRGYSAQASAHNHKTLLNLNEKETELARMLFLKCIVVAQMVAFLCGFIDSLAIINCCLHSKQARSRLYNPFESQSKDL